MYSQDYLDLLKAYFSGSPRLYCMVVSLCTVVLFYGLYSIASKHFSPSLHHLSVAMRLSPELTSTTLLAFGSGAPDFFTSMFGAAESPRMIIGSSIGSGVLILTIVLGSVILFARERTTTTVGSSEEYKAPIQITETNHKPIDSSNFNNRLSSDFVHNNHLRSKESGNSSIGDAKDINYDIEASGKQKKLQSRLVNRSWLSERLPTLKKMPYLRGGMLYILCIIFLGCFLVAKSIPFWLPLLLLLIYVIYMVTVVTLYVKNSRINGQPLISNNDATPLAIREAREAEIQRAWIGLGALGPVGKCIYCIKYGYFFSHKSMPLYRRALFIIIKILRSPIDLMLALSIFPVYEIEVSSDEKNIDGRQFLALSIFRRLRCLINPAAMAIFFGIMNHQLLGKMYYVVSAVIVVIVLMPVIWKTTYWDAPPRGFIIHVNLAFLMCILWIYVFSNEVVRCLEAFGTAAGISETVMGVVVLAWGNSFGDLVANVAIARSAAYETAIIAVFSGPIQNVLLTIGASFLVASLRTGEPIKIGYINADLLLSLFFLISVVLIQVVAVPFLYRMRIPRYFGLILVIIYAIYLPLAIFFGIFSPS